MGGKLTSGGIKLPNTGEVEQTKVVVSVDGFEADETGNIDIGGSFDYTSKTTQVGGSRSISRHGLRIYGIDDYLRKLSLQGDHLLLRDESLSMSRLNGEYVYIAEENELENESAFYRSDNGGLTYTREKLPTSNIQVKMTKVSETGEHVAITGSNNKVYLSSDYGKTFIELNSSGSTSNVYMSNYVLSISRDGSKLITAHNSQNDTLIRWENGSPTNVTFAGGAEAVTIGQIVDIEIGNNRNIVFLTSANVLYSTTNNGSSWTSTSNVTSFGVNGDVTQIYYGTTDRKIKVRAINSSTSTTKLDLDTEYSNLDPDDAFIKSIKVSKDGTKISATVLHNAHLTNWGINPDKPNTLISDGTDTDGYQNREYNLNGLIFSEDSGQNWSLSKIKATGVHHVFLGGSTFQYNGFWRHIASDDLEKCFLAINSHVREMIKVTPKSIAAINTSNLIVDGGIILGQSLEADTEWQRRLSGTLEYSPYYQRFNFHMSDSFMSIGKELASAVQSSTTNDVEGKPLTVVVDSSNLAGEVQINPSNKISGMASMESAVLASDIINMPPYQPVTTDAKVVQMQLGAITPTTINVSDISTLAARVTALENAVGTNIVLLDHPVKVTSFTPTNGIYWGVEYNVDNSSYTMPLSPTPSDYKLPLDLSDVPANAVGIILHVAATFVSNGAGTIRVYVSSTAQGGQNNTDVTDEIEIYHGSTSGDWQGDVSFGGTIFLKAGQRVLSNDHMTWVVSGYLI